MCKGRVINMSKAKTDEAFKYTKNAILSAENIIYNKDVLSILLEDNRGYTLDEVEKLVDDFNKKEVK